MKALTILTLIALLGSLALYPSGASVSAHKPSGCKRHPTVRKAWERLTPEERRIWRRLPPSDRLRLARDMLGEDG